MTIFYQKMWIQAMDEATRITSAVGCVAHEASIRSTHKVAWLA